MVTKFTLTSGGIETALDSQSLKNWGDVMCSYSRSDYGGIVRKFTSAFEFTLEAYDYLMALYLEKGFKAECVLAIYTLNDDWSFSKQFECPLDFSTIKWTDTVLSISSVDNSLAALIKANKSTKYELEVGTDIVADGTFHFDRLLMQESATYEFTQGTSDESTGRLTVRMDKGEMPWLGNVASEINVGGAILYADDQGDDADEYCVKAYKDIAVNFSWSIDYDTYNSGGGGAIIRAEQVRNGSVVDQKYMLTLGGGTSNTYLGIYADEAGLPEPGSGTSDVGKWARLSGSEIVWIIMYNGRGGYWVNTGKTAIEYFRSVSKGTFDFNMASGDIVRIVADIQQTYTLFTLNSSSFIFSWKTKGDVCDMPTFVPKTVAEAILKKMAGDNLRVLVEISDFDERLAKTALVAAESVRGIDGAKFYSSFNEFCDWMSAVFGYIYEIGDAKDGLYDRIVNVGSVNWRTCSVEANQYDGDVDPSKIVYLPPMDMFFYYADDGKFYISWNGKSDICKENNRPYDNVLYKFSDSYGLCYMVYDSVNKYHKPVKYDGDEDTALALWQTVKFLHRSELFSGVVSKDIGNVLDLNYSVTSSSIYSTIEAGYEQKDYDSINGRDEFNFTNVYSTGCTATDKKLSLISKYRADCYGLEFAAQKRGEDTTDSTSDNDVFFVYCSVSGTDYSPARSCSIENALSDTVFNGEFSPMACVRANAGYIGMQEADMVLAFASATGNSSIVIDGESLSSDLTLGEALMTCGVIEFTTDDQEVTANLNNAVRLKSNGIEYVGYISDLDLKYARPEPASYKLLVKSISLS